MYAAEDCKYLIEQNERMGMISSEKRWKTQLLAKPNSRCHKCSFYIFWHARLTLLNLYTSSYKLINIDRISWKASDWILLRRLRDLNPSASRLDIKIACPASWNLNCLGLLVQHRLSETAMSDNPHVWHELISNITVLIHSPKPQNLIFCNFQDDHFFVNLIATWSLLLLYNPQAAYCWCWCLGQIRFDDH